MKSFVYLIQHDSDIDMPGLADDDNDVILLTWKTPSSRVGAVFYPDSSWNEGRNRLLAEARQRDENGAGYRYYIFLDGDCVVEEDPRFAERVGYPLTGNPFRTFEKFLLDWQPAIGYTRYDWQYTEKHSVVNLGYNFDALFNAYHRDVVDLLLPYYTGFDSESWLYSQHLINHLAAMMVNPYRLQFNPVVTRNPDRHGYRIRKKYWHIPTTFLREAVTGSIRDHMNTADPNTIQPLAGSPRKKDIDYRVPVRTMNRHFDMTHPLMTHRRGVALKAGPRKRIKRTAVCLTGSCRMLDQTAANIAQQLLSRIGSHDLFVYVPDDGHGHKVRQLAPAALRVVPDHPIDPGDLVHGKNCLIKSGVQAYLQQLNGLKMVNRLRHDYGRTHRITYDCVIRCRPDVWFLEPLPDIRTLDLNYLHVPDFHCFDGLNDRFAVGNPDDMDVYMNKIGDVYDYVRRWTAAARPGASPVSAEMFTAGQLRWHGVRTRLMPVRFNRVRDYGMKLDTEVKGKNGVGDSG